MPNIHTIAFIYGAFRNDSRRHEAGTAAARDAAQVFQFVPRHKRVESAAPTGRNRIDAITEWAGPPGEGGRRRVTLAS